MNPRIKLLENKKLVGCQLRMSVANNKTFELWNGFIKSRKNIKNVIGTDLYSIQIYDQPFDFKQFDPRSEFTMWAAIEVESLINLPHNLHPYTLEGGLYAVFIHRGLTSDFQKTAQYIFSQWLPASPYELDSRAHFQVMGDKYKRNDPSSEEEVWIPVV